MWGSKPSAISGQGTDPFYAVTNGADGQLGIAGVAPGDRPYHGGAWKMFTVTFATGVSPYLLTSDEAVFGAQRAGDVTVMGAAAADFRCPVTAYSCSPWKGRVRTRSLPALRNVNRR